MGDFVFSAVFYRPLLVDDWFGGTIETWGLSSILGKKIIGILIIGSISPWRVRLTITEIPIG